MGIQNLSKVLEEHCPGAIKSKDIKNYGGYKIAIDASMFIYQFLIAVRSEGNTLVNSEGETTSHLMGIFYRTLRMIDNGVKPFYVFDGKPPDLKGGELLKRSQRREEAEEKKKKAEDEGDNETLEKMNKRLVKVSSEHNEQCKQLLTLMGVPVVQAPCEAEAQCSEFVKSDKVFGVGTEDMDALTFGGKVLLRNLSQSESKKAPIKEYDLDKILETMELTMDQFIDMCILLGCDYCESIKGVGPKKAVEFVKKYKSIENILEHLDSNKYIIPENWNYAGARKLFRDPEVIKSEDINLEWKSPDEEGIIELMCNKNNFNEDRIRKGILRLSNARSTSVQTRIDSFFQKVPTLGNKRPQPIKDNKVERKKSKVVKKK